MGSLYSWGHRATAQRTHALRRLCNLPYITFFIKSNSSYCPLTWHFRIYDDYKSTYEFLQITVIKLKTNTVRTIALETIKSVNYKCPLFMQFMQIKH